MQKPISQYYINKCPQNQIIFTVLLEQQILVYKEDKIQYVVA